MDSFSDDVCHSTDESFALFNRGRNAVSRGLLRIIQQSSLRDNPPSVCAYPFQPSAMASFHRLLSLPAPVLRVVIRLASWDLQAGQADSIGSPQLRLCLVSMGGSAVAAAAAAAATGGTGGRVAGGDNLGDTLTAPPGQPGVQIQPPRLILQWIVTPGPRTQSASTSIASTFLSSQLPPVGRLVRVAYNWETNGVSILPPVSPSTPAATQQFVQHLRASNLAGQAQQAAAVSSASTGKTESALLHLALLVDQVASSF
ncbi:unnamed protein product [Protopolystoma xenopodis]|uniref:Uncharacterized protein n=1 Tax=Protopolystoma xenopodis TaxID=117903 RepID=A0A3S5AUC0_9PLAT|nr:unnamed protein product [Protopolystoma xenopodis]